MSLADVRGDHLRLILSDHARHGIRGGSGVVFLILTLLVGLVIANVFISPLEAIQARMAVPGGRTATLKDVGDEIVELGRTPLKWALGADDVQFNYLARENPAMVSAIMVVLLFFVPFLVSMGTFNQFAGDIQSKGLRYLLLRTERSNIFFGRFLGAFIFSSIVMGILFLVIFLYLVLKAKLYPVADVAPWMLKGYLAVLLLSLPYTALSAWLSAANDSPGIAFVIGQLIIGFVPVFVGIAAGITPEAAWLGYILPWPLKLQLLHPAPLMSGGAAVAMLAYTALFLWLGHRTFNTRDL